MNPMAMSAAAGTAGRCDAPIRHTNNNYLYSIVTRRRIVLLTLMSVKASEARPSTAVPPPIKYEGTGSVMIGINTPAARAQTPPIKEYSRRRARNRSLKRYG